MPMTITNFTDGEDKINCQIQLPDSGSAVQIQGEVLKGGLSPVQISGSPLTAPSPPGSGSIFWNIQVEGQTGVASVQQSTSADPPLNTLTSLIVFRQTLVSTSSDLAQTPSSTPDVI